MKLKYFKPEEFREWWEEMNPFLLVKLDSFREEWGKGVWISPAYGALGRHLGPTNTSQHNVDRWGMVNAVDVFPIGMETGKEFERGFNIAKSVGFTGIGVYPNWTPKPGMHLDVRTSSPTGEPAKWSAFTINGKQRYYGIDLAFNM